MKFAELYEESMVDYVEELDQTLEYGGVEDALDMLSRGRLRNITRYAPLVHWFERNAGRIANYAVGEIYAEGTAGIRYEANRITDAGIDLPNKSITAHMMKIMPQLVGHINHMSEEKSNGAANAMVGLKTYHDIDIKQYIQPEIIEHIIADSIIDNNIGVIIQVLKVVLGADNTTASSYLNEYKHEIIKSLLVDLKAADPWEVSVLTDRVNTLLSMGLPWPELNIMQKSLSLRSKNSLLQ